MRRVFVPFAHAAVGVKGRRCEGIFMFCCCQGYRCKGYLSRSRISVEQQVW